MSPTVKLVPSDEKLPRAADVVVIGAGILGASAAFYLARRGISVALIEKGNVGCEQSSRNWGWCRQQNRDVREMPLSMLAMRLWDEAAAQIGEDLGFRRCGLLYASDDDGLLAEWEKWQDVARKFGVETRMLSAAEVTQKIPATKRKWRGGLQAARDGKAEPALAAPVFASGARNLGATIHQQCAAHGVEFADGAVRGVHTEKGYIAADAVLCSAGVWASAFCHSLGISFPQASVRQTALRSRPAPNIGEIIYTPDCALTRRLDGSYTMAISGRATLEVTPQGLRFAKPFIPMFNKRLKAVRISVGKSFISGPESLAMWYSGKPERFGRIRTLDPDPSQSVVRLVLDRVRSNFPELADIEISEAWGAYVDSTPDALPVISPVENAPGLFLAAGCSGHGFGLGPGVGYLAAQLIVNDTPSADPAPFRLSRLLDGSKIEVGAI